MDILWNHSLDFYIPYMYIIKFLYICMKSNKVTIMDSTFKIVFCPGPFLGIQVFISKYAKVCQRLLLINESLMKVNTLPLLSHLKLVLHLVFALSALVIPCCFVAGRQSQLNVLLV